MIVVNIKPPIELQCLFNFFTYKADLIRSGYCLQKPLEQERLKDGKLLTRTRF